VASAFALGWGLSFNWRGLALNVAASLVLIGPAVVLSNIIVKRIQDARAKRRTVPFLYTVAQLLHWAVRSAQQAFDMLGVEATVDLPSDDDPFPTLDRVEAALADALTQLESATEGRELPRTLNLVAPLVFPPFGVVRSLIEQIDRSYPMPWTVGMAHITEDWSDRRGIDFYYARPIRGPVRRRYVGLGQIEEHSWGTNSTTAVHRRDYLGCVLGSLRHAQAIIRRLIEEIPPSLRTLPSQPNVAVRATDLASIRADGSEDGRWLSDGSDDDGQPPPPDATGPGT
jgi:hypothetical protein